MRVEKSHTNSRLQTLIKSYPELHQGYIFQQAGIKIQKQLIPTACGVINIMIFAMKATIRPMNRIPGFSEKNNHKKYITILFNINVHTAQNIEKTRAGRPFFKTKIRQEMIVLQLVIIEDEYNFEVP